MTNPLSENSRVRIVGIVGSLRTKSYTRMAVQAALTAAREAGAEMQLIDLRDYNLVFCDGETPDAELPEGVHRLRTDVAAAHGIILGTPEYHGGYSGVLKNALDLLGFRQVGGKVIGLIAVAGGALGGSYPLSALRAVCRSLHGWAIPEQVVIPSASDKFADDGTPTDPGTAKRLDTLGRQVTRFAYLHSSERARSFLEAWEQAMENPGGE